MILSSEKFHVNLLACFSREDPSFPTRETACFFTRSGGILNLATA